ncbi:hypothetical protein FOZ63_033604 [Perkinsus olseni]|uniref:EF-hand domain-containing protein n=1 Tax=Perkinsus olseni TaxID=32597 RepID=A0A7J6TCX4_PEROL|nr:hypothetical protein FOZ63_033604 [Perkinsus olseni]
MDETTRSTGQEGADFVGPSWLRNMDAGARGYHITEGDIGQVFAMLDSDTNGVISLSEVSEMIRMIGLDADDPKVRDFLNDVDDIGDIDRAAYGALMKWRVSLQGLGIPSKNYLALCHCQLQLYARPREHVVCHGLRRFSVEMFSRSARRRAA